jgi:26S proteasome regulatory subunit T1
MKKKKNSKIKNIEISSKLISIINFQNQRIKIFVEKAYQNLNSEDYFIPSHLWDLQADKNKIDENKTLQIAYFSQFFFDLENQNCGIIDLKNVGKFVVSFGEQISPTDIQESNRIAVDRNKYQIQIILPTRIDPQISIMAIEEKPIISYKDIGGCKNEILNIREIVEYPLLYPQKFIQLGLEPPKGVMLYGPPGTGKTLIARAVANRTDSCFIKVICSELVQKYIGEGARMVRELFKFAKKKISCIVFFDELDAIGGTRFDDGAGGDNEVQRTMLEIVNQLDGFEKRGNIKVLMATNRPDTIDPALTRPGRIDRKIEFGLPNLDGRIEIFKIHTIKMIYDLNLRFELLARLCPFSTGADLRSICTEAGMFAIRKNKIIVSENDFLKAINKVIKKYAKFNATPKYINFNQ